MTDNFSNDENALFKAQIREQDIAASQKLQKLQEIQGAADEFARQKIINKLRRVEAEHEKLTLELEQEASGRVDNILSYVELRTEGNEGYFADNEMVLESFWQLFKPLFDYFKVDADFEAYRVKKEKEEGWLAAIIKFLRDARDALKELIKKIFSADLSWDQRLDKEIKELEAKLSGSKLSEEEFARVYERLEFLQQVKLRLQICLAGCAVIILARLFSAELTALVETTKEEGKEKTSAKEKEAAKEVHEIIEIKLDTKGRYQIIVPSYLLDFSSGVAKPITLTKQELDLLPKPQKDLVHFVHKDDMNKGNSVVPKQEVKEKQGQENKKAKSEAPKEVVRSTETSRKNPVIRKLKVSGSLKRSTSFIERDSDYNVTSSVNGVGTMPTNQQGTDDPYAELAKEVTKIKAQREKSASGIEHNYPIDHFQVPAETNGKSHANAKSEPKQGSVNNAQPKSECSSVKINNHVESIGKAQEEISSRGI